MHETYSPLALANTFIDKYGRNEGIQHMKLQKLAYYAHGWWLSYYDSPFLTERPQVWRYGPVFKSMYNALKHFGSNSIRIPQSATPFEKPEIISSGDVLSLISWVWERYSPYSAITLSDKTHETGTPWRIIAEKCNFLVPENYVIPDDLIRDYFRAEAKELKPE